jgi:hypothetical protein
LIRLKPKKAFIKKKLAEHGAFVFGEKDQEEIFDTSPTKPRDNLLDCSLFYFQNKDYSD